jgi:hypothetical protein
MQDEEKEVPIFKSPEENQEMVEGESEETQSCKMSKEREHREKRNEQAENLEVSIVNQEKEGDQNEETPSLELSQKMQDEEKVWPIFESPEENQEMVEGESEETQSCEVSKEREHREKRNEQAENLEVSIVNQEKEEDQNEETPSLELSQKMQDEEKEVPIFESSEENQEMKEPESEVTQSCEVSKEREHREKESDQAENLEVSIVNQEKEEDQNKETPSLELSQKVQDEEKEVPIFKSSEEKQEMKEAESKERHPVLLYVDQEMQCLRQELTESQVYIPAVKMSFETQTKSSQETLATTESDFCAELDLTHIESQPPRTEPLTHQHNMAAETKATQRKFQSQLEGAVTRVELTNGQGACARTAQPLIFDGSTAWAVFQRHFLSVAERNQWMPLEKSIYLLTALKGRPANVLLTRPFNPTSWRQSSL